MQVKVDAYQFGLTGLSISYTKDTANHILTLDPCGTCQVFEDLGIIEGFQIDCNGEPVILWQDSDYGRPVIEHCLWCDFMSFPFIQRHAEIIIEDRERRKASRQFQAAINNLLSPLQAA